MNNQRNIRWARCLAMALFLNGVCSMAVEQSGVFFYDFENGMPANARLESSLPKQKQKPNAEVETNTDGAVLELGKHALLKLSDDPLLNFSIEATIRREYDNTQAHAGFQFRNGYRVYIRKPGSVELSGPNNARGGGFTRIRSTHAPFKFKIVVVGPVVRFFVDGKYEGQFDNLDLTPGPIALYQRGLQHNVYFDDVKINTRVKPAQFLACQPVTNEDQALVFPPSDNVELKFNVTNHYSEAQDAELGVILSTFDDQLVFDTTTAPVPIAPSASAELKIGLGAVPEGFYRLKFLPTGKVAPLAVHVKGTVAHEEITTPKILTGVYWYYLAWKRLPTSWWNTYMHAAANDLRRHHFNTVICAMGMPTKSIEILGQYGIRCFTRGVGAKKNITHPNVIGGLIGDEPHHGDEQRYIRDYSKYTKAHPDKEFTTCMIADAGVAACKPWWDSWTPLSETNKIIPMFRWYGIKKFQVGLSRQYKSHRPLTETLRDMTDAWERYYFIMPSFGTDKGIKAYFSNPLPAQIRGMMHLGAAHQAKGLFFWAYQTPFVDHESFVEPATLLPLDGKWAAAGDAAEKIMKNVDLLADCQWKERYAYVDGPATLEAFVLKRPKDPADYIYLVNLDTTQSVNGRLFELNPDRRLYDLFNDQEVPIGKGTVQLKREDQTARGAVASVSLLPGDGMLLKYDVAKKTEGQEIAAAPRVLYPKAVAEIPEDRAVWLVDLEPVEMPVPGWYPQVKFKGKKWFPDYHAKDLKLFSGPGDVGQLYKNSLWAHAETHIKYKLPAGTKMFAAAAGFGNRDAKSSAIFRVLVDGQEKYNSGIMRLGDKVQPVVVDVGGGELLELVTEEGGDGLYGDYTFWGEARLLK